MWELLTLHKRYNAELEHIKQESIKLKEQLLQIKEMREMRQRHADEVILRELRRGVQELQVMDRIMEERKQKVEEVVDDLGKQLEAAMEKKLRGEAKRKLAAIDLQEIVTGVPSQPGQRQTAINVEGLITEATSRILKGYPGSSGGTAGGDAPAAAGTRPHSSSSSGSSNGGGNSAKSKGDAAPSSSVVDGGGRAQPAAAARPGDGGSKAGQG